MPLPLPNLDDRDHEQLLRDAVQRIRRSSPDWDGLSPSDPGVVLLDVFVHLTDTMIHQLNRVPDKVYRAFLRMMDVTLHPPSAASVTLHFTRNANFQGVIEIPRGTEVTFEQTAGGDTPVFITASSVTLRENETTVDVLALHCEEVRGEVIGMGTGMPGLSVIVSKPPIIDSTGDPLDLVIGVETSQEELVGRQPVLSLDGKKFRLWREVGDFSQVKSTAPFVYVADRMAGIITFAPSLREEYEVDERSGRRALAETAQTLGAVPGQGREIRAWYRRGGGLAGNVMANRLTKLKAPINGVTVTNPAAATGGRSGESLENALLRAPRNLRTLDRAVTADDYETLALHTQTIARAHASTGKDLWSYAPRGMVLVTIVPYVPDTEWTDGKLAAAQLHAHETQNALGSVQQLLNLKRPLGAECRVIWGAYKSVKARATIIASREEDRKALQERVIERLHRTINPLPSPGFNEQGWAFGASLHVSHIYDAILAEPGVRWVDKVSLIVDDVPLEVAVIAADYHQRNTWYAGSKQELFRSLNGGDGWERVVSFGPEERIERIESHQYLPGLVAATTYIEPKGEHAAEARVYVSADCGENWKQVYLTDAHVVDIGWSIRDNDRPILFMATDVGLFEIADPLRGGELVRVVVDHRNPDMAFYAVASIVDPSGMVYVVVAAQDKGGVYASIKDGREFRQLVGMQDKDVRVLAIQADSGGLMLWAGTYALGESAGDGCFRWGLRGELDPPAGWESFNAGWEMGGCRQLAFIGGRVFAATYRGGVVSLNANSRTPKWEGPDVTTAGLPVRDLKKGRFLTISTVATNPKTGRIMAGVMTSEHEDIGKGIYRSRQMDMPYSTWVYKSCSSAVFDDQVTLPETWLIVSGEHEIEVISEDDKRDSE